MAVPNNDLIASICNLLSKIKDAIQHFVIQQKILKIETTIVTTPIADAEYAFRFRFSDKARSKQKQQQLKVVNDDVARAVTTSSRS